MTFLCILHTSKSHKIKMGHYPCNLTRICILYRPESSLKIGQPNSNWDVKKQQKHRGVTTPFSRNTNCYYSHFYYFYWIYQPDEIITNIVHDRNTKYKCNCPTLNISRFVIIVVGDHLFIFDEMTWLSVYIILMTVYNHKGHETVLLFAHYIIYLGPEDCKAFQ